MFGSCETGRAHRPQFPDDPEKKESKFVVLVSVDTVTLTGEINERLCTSLQDCIDQ